MKYTILVYESPTDFGARTDDQRKEAYWGAYRSYTRALTEAGVFLGGSGLEPTAAAATLRQRDGRRQVQDGPYAESKEQLGGYYIIEAPDMEHALEWAARCPAASSGAVEVRPHLRM